MKGLILVGGLGTQLVRYHHHQPSRSATITPFPTQTRAPCRFTDVSEGALFVALAAAADTVQAKAAH